MLFSLPSLKAPRRKVTHSWHWGLLTLIYLSIPLRYTPWWRAVHGPFHVTSPRSKPRDLSSGNHSYIRRCTVLESRFRSCKAFFLFSPKLKFMSAIFFLLKQSSLLFCLRQADTLDVLVAIHFRRSMASLHDSTQSRMMNQRLSAVPSEVSRFSQLLSPSAMKQLTAWDRVDGSTPVSTVSRISFTCVLKGFTLGASLLPSLRAEYKVCK